MSTTAGRLINASGTIAAGATAQDALAEAARQYLLIQNPIGAAETLFVDIGTTAAPATAIGLAAGERLVFENSFCPSQRVSVYATTIAHAYVCKWA